jgi:predicted RNA-binding protein YlqC (UPF0109 family)
MSNRIAEYVEYVVESLVDEPEAVNVTEGYEGDDLYVDVEVAPGERGRVIGRQGRVIRSLRVVVRAAAGRDGSRATVELVEDDDADQAAAAPAAEGGSGE